VLLELHDDVVDDMFYLDFSFFALVDFLMRPPIGTVMASASSSMAAYRFDMVIGGRRSNSGTVALQSLSHDSRRLVLSLRDEPLASDTILTHPRERK